MSGSTPSSSLSPRTRGTTTRLIAATHAVVLVPLVIALRLLGADLGELVALVGFVALGVVVLLFEATRNAVSHMFATTLVPVGASLLASTMTETHRDVFVPLIMGVVAFAAQPGRWWSVAVGWLACTLAWWYLLIPKGPGGLVETLLLSGLYALVATVLHSKAERTRALSRALRVEADAAQEGAKVKSRFLKVMSHELKTPLNGVVGMTELALAGPLTVEQRGALETVLSSTDWLNRTIHQMLEFARAERGILPVHDEPWEPRASLEELLRVLAPAAHQRGLELVLDIDPAVPFSSRGNGFQLRQVLAQLVTNGIKFTEVGSVTARVSAPASGWLRFEVLDTGIGIAAEHQARIFEAFAQVDMGSNRRFDGVGLGLTLAGELTRRVGGRLSVGWGVGFTQVGASARWVI